MPCRLTLIGSGNSAHVCAGLVHSNTRGQTEVRILTRSPEVFTNSRPTVTLQDGSTREGFISKVSSDPAVLIPDCDIVIWTGPSHASRDVFQWIAPHVSSSTVVVTIFGQGLVHLMIHRLFGAKVRFVALRNIPWLCRTTKRGFSSEIVGAKTSIEASTLNVDARWLTENLEPLFLTPHGPRIEYVSDFSPIVFNPANQIIHPAVYWGLFRKWNGITPLASLPNDGWLYRGMDEIAGHVLATLDEELQAITKAFFEATGMEGCKVVLPLQERVLKQYTTQVSDASTMAKTIGTNKAYGMARTPFLAVGGGFAPNPQHRVVQDDIGWGLCVLVSIAERLNVPVTTMIWLIEWHQRMMGKCFITNGKLAGPDVKDLVVLLPHEPLSLVGGIVSERPIAKL